MVDVAGGNGHLLLDLLAEPTITRGLEKVVLFDLPQTLTDATVHAFLAKGMHTLCRRDLLDRPLIEKTEVGEGIDMATSSHAARGACVEAGSEPLSLPFVALGGPIVEVQKQGVVLRTGMYDKPCTDNS